MRKIGQDAVPVIEEVSVATVSCTLYSLLHYLWWKGLKSISMICFFCIQLARLQNSMILKAADALDFQRDMFGSIGTLLCKTQTDSNSTKMPFTLRSPRSMHHNMANSMGNSSGKCCSKQLRMQMSHCSCVLIICLHCSFTVVDIVMPGNGQNCSHLFRNHSACRKWQLTFSQYAATGLRQNCAVFGKSGRTGNKARSVDRTKEVLNLNSSIQAFPSF